MLNTAPVIPFLATTNPAASIAFYRDILGLEFIEDTPFAVVFRTWSGTLHISKVEAFTPQPFTVLGFTVEDIVTQRVALGTKGVTFERYPFMPQDNLDLMTFEGGARVCWFKDPDGNLLSLTQLPPSE